MLGLFALTTGFPKQETYGLSLQMRRAAVSIPAKSSPPCWNQSAGSSARTPQPFWLLTPDFLDSHIPPLLSKTGRSCSSVC